MSLLKNQMRPNFEMTSKQDSTKGLVPKYESKKRFALISIFRLGLNYIYTAGGLIFSKFWFEGKIIIWK